MIASKVNVNRNCKIEVKVVGGKRLSFRIRAVAFLVNLFADDVKVDVGVKWQENAKTEGKQNGNT